MQKKFGSIKKILTFAFPKEKRSVRITVSTQDSQSCNRGSIPLPTTKTGQHMLTFINDNNGRFV